MGSHYIPVGKLKVDKDLLDIVCPAAGYDTTPPPPAIYCPANGYYPQTDEFIPPYTFDEIPTGDDEIILIVENKSTNTFRFELGTNGSLLANRFIVTVEEFDKTVLYTFNPVYLNKFIEIDTWPVSISSHLVIRFKQLIAEETFKNFRVYQSGTYVFDTMPIVEARFNTPAMQSLNTAFYSIKTIQRVVFYRLLNSLTSTNNMFYSSGIKSFVFPFDLPNLESMESMFEGSQVKSVDFNNKKFPSLLSLKNFFRNCSEFDNYLNFNPGEIPLVDASGMFAGTIAFTKSINLSGAIVTSENLIALDALASTTNARELILFKTNGQLVKYRANYTISNAINLRKVKVYGNVHFSAYYFNYTNTPNIVEVEFDKGISSEYPKLISNSTTNKIETIVLPTERFGADADDPDMPLLSGINAYLADGLSNLKTFVNTPAYIGNAPFRVRIFSPFLTEFNFATMRVSEIFLGTNASSAIASINIDWANSFATYTANAVLIQLKGKLSTASLDAIFSALPTISVAAKIDVRYTTGYSACDKTIATAKGWTVL